MNKIVTLFVTLLICGQLIYAQETPKIEVFGGYSYLTTSEGDDLQGWTGSAVKNINHWFGLKGEISGYSTKYTDLAGDTLSVSNHLFLAGGQFTYRKLTKLQPFAHLMAGSALLKAKVDGAGGALSASGSGLVIVLGGGADFKIAKALAIRLIQADYLIIREDGFNSRGLRLSTGLVYRAGWQ